NSPLPDSHWDVGDCAFEALNPLIETFSRLGDVRLIKPLGRILAIEIGYPAVSSAQKSAIKALGKIGGASAVEILTPFSEDRSNVEYFRIKAIETLGRLGDKRAVEPLVRSLKLFLNKNSTGLLKTVEALVKLGWKPSDDDPDSIRITYLLLTRKWDDLTKMGVHAYYQLSHIWDSMYKGEPYNLELDYEIKEKLEAFLEKIKPLYEAMLVEDELKRRDEHLKSVRKRFPKIEEFSKTPIVGVKEWSQALESNPSIYLKFAR
ncbi:unnamed protein product, partial [marine sediment metagenome]